MGSLRSKSRPVQGFQVRGRSPFYEIQWILFLTFPRWPDYTDDVVLSVCVLFGPIAAVRVEWPEPGVSMHARLQQRVLVGGTFFPIRVASLRVDTIVHFDFYIRSRPAAPPVLYRERNLPFTEETKYRLAESSVAELFVPSGQVAEYRRYVEANLNAVLSDPDVDIVERSEVLYDSASGLVKDAFENPRSGEVLQRSRALVENAVSFVFTQQASVESLLKVTSTDYYTYTHCVNVFVFSIAFARRLGLEGQTVLNQANGALLHDIGKCRIPASVLNNPGKLTAEEWEQMKLHPVHGYDLLRSQGVQDDVMLDVTRHHHEKLTGKGYPDNLAGVEISMFARMSTISDIFDALTTRRSYKDAMTSFDALRLMKKEMAQELDHDLFESFVEMMGDTSGEKVAKGMSFAG